MVPHARSPWGPAQYTNPCPWGSAERVGEAARRGQPHVTGPQKARLAGRARAPTTLGHLAGAGETSAWRPQPQEEHLHRASHPAGRALCHGANAHAGGGAGNRHARCPLRGLCGRRITCAVVGVEVSLAGGTVRRNVGATFQC